MGSSPNLSHETPGYSDITNKEREDSVKRPLVLMFLHLHYQEDERFGMGSDRFANAFV